MLLLEVTLCAGQGWTYEASFPDEVAWLFVHRGALAVGEVKTSGELVVFDEQPTSVSVHAKTHAHFIFGAASRIRKSPVSDWADPCPRRNSHYLKPNSESQP